MNKKLIVDYQLIDLQKEELDKRITDHENGVGITLHGQANAQQEIVLLKIPSNNPGAKTI